VTLLPGVGLHQFSRARIVVFLIAQAALNSLWTVLGTPRIIICTVSSADFIGVFAILSFS